MSPSHRRQAPSYEAGGRLQASVGGKKGTLLQPGEVGCNSLRKGMDLPLGNNGQG